MSFREQFAQGVFRFFSWAWLKHPGKLIGTSFGFVFGLLLVTLGFWRAIVLLLFILTGFFLGKRHDDHHALGQLFDRFFQK